MTDRLINQTDIHVGPSDPMLCFGTDIAQEMKVAAATPWILKPFFIFFNLRLKNKKRETMKNYNNILISISEITIPQLSTKFKGYAGIYIWTNTTTGETYIGSSLNLSRRIIDYGNKERLKRELFRGESRIYRAILKYGIEVFTFKILEIYTIDSNLSVKNNTDNLRFREDYFIDKLKPTYNIIKQNSGIGISGRTISPEVVLVLLKAHQNLMHELVLYSRVASTQIIHVY